MMSSEINLNALLKKYYGYDTFRSHQKDVIETAMRGFDSLVLMPTGGGKSLCYQIPALAMPGITVVISPLIALMKDQVDALRANGIPAAAINSNISEAEISLIKQQCIYGKLKLLYISPERVLVEIDYLLRRMQISLFAIDEAHCISQWGHDFRPQYTELAKLKQFFPTTPFMALTATADKLTREDIQKQLRLNNPQVFISSFDRPNLSLKVMKGYKKKQKIDAIIDFIESHPRQSGIVYCLSRNNTEQLAKELKESGIDAEAYHAGLPSAERERIQSDFLNDRVTVMCATIAFGMGIDKSNVRWVIHYNMPKSIECYYQEIGRAGRDGLDGDTMLFYSLGDIVMLSKFASESGQSEINLEKLNRMQQYAEADVCRRRILLSYFGESMDSDCGNCDVCRNPPKRFDGTILVQKALSAIIRTDQKIGIHMLIDILRGSKRLELVEKGYDKIKTFGVGKDLSHAQWNGYLLQMLQLGCFEIVYNQGSILRATEFGISILRNEREIELHEAIVEPTTVVETSKRRKSSTAGFANRTIANTELLSESDQLFESLRKLRKEIADREDVPAYIIFTDKVLDEMVKHRPLDIKAFGSVEGVGVHKASKYGKAFVEVIKGEEKAKSQRRDIKNKTLQLLISGNSVDDVVKLYRLQRITVYSHIAQLYTEGKLKDYYLYIEDYELHTVRNAWLIKSRTNELKVIFDALQGAVEYGKIRLALAILNKEENF